MKGEAIHAVEGEPAPVRLRNTPRFTEVRAQGLTLTIIRFSVCWICGTTAPMKRAVVDIGTNTVKLLVAEVDEQGGVLELVAKDSPTRLGEGLITTDSECATKQVLSRSAMARTIAAVVTFAAEARALGVDHIAAVTTSAVRDAVNRNEFVDSIRCQCGLTVRVVTGDEEAQLIFRGVCSDPSWAGAALLVMDVGGGSAEAIQGTAGRVERHASWPLGAVRLKEQFGEGRWDAMRTFVREKLSVVLRGYTAKGRRMIATGGGINICAKLLAGQADGTVIPREWLRESLAKLEAMPLDLRRTVPGLPPDRADIIVPGAEVFVAAMDILGFSEMTVSTRSLRYGLLATPNL
jgi:exopolyphosphatase/guanosine-5'-triphosphate,3'-diphosphate pyrophosphatase